MPQLCHSLPCHAMPWCLCRFPGWAKAELSKNCVGTTLYYRVDIEQKCLTATPGQLWEGVLFHTSPSTKSALWPKTSKTVPGKYACKTLFRKWHGLRFRAKLSYSHPYLSVLNEGGSGTFVILRDTGFLSIPLVFQPPKAIFKTAPFREAKTARKLPSAKNWPKTA